MVFLILLTSYFFIGIMGIIILPLRLYKMKIHIYALPQTLVHYMNLKSVSISLHVRRIEIDKLCILDHVDVVSSKA